MAFMEWSEALSVGFEEIDDDHKHLLDLINKLHEAVDKGHNTGIVSELLEELLSYTSWHFRHEERLMQTFDDPSFLEHKVEHEKLAAAVAQKKRSLAQGDPAVARDLLPFLRDWLTGHILETDRKTGQFLAQTMG